ncbi:MAG: hypothetical protein JWO82_1381 [Akkermansiaceae bacterium]|nr:hypothetical protein [Akkermansiaceae bacterium]
MELEAAEGYAELELWREAWQTLDRMDPIEKGQPEALRLRLRCCGPLGAWTIGEHVANILRDGDKDDRQAAARFFLDHARAHPGHGSGSLAAAVETWPPALREINADPELAAIAGKH